MPWAPLSYSQVLLHMHSWGTEKHKWSVHFLDTIPAPNGSIPLTGNHDGFGVASKALLQQPGQHRVPVWDVRLPPRRSPSVAGPRCGAGNPTVTPTAGCTTEALATAEHLWVLGLIDRKTKVEKQNKGRILKVSWSKYSKNNDYRT